MSRNQILIDGVMAFDSWDTSDTTLALLSPVFKGALNKHASLGFGIPKTHPLADAIIPLITQVSVIQDGTEIFYGRVRKVSHNIWGTADVACEGPTACLNDTIQPPWKWTGSVSGLLQYFLNVHNASTTGPTWVLGNVTVTNPGNSITRWSSEYYSTWEVLVGRFPDSSLGGYLIARHGTGNTMILDYLETPGPLSGQVLHIGENIIDINQILDATKVATRLIPLGATLPEDEEETSTGNGPIPPTRVGIESVNGGQSWVEDTALVNTLGAITATHTWDDVTQPTTLLQHGYDELARRKVAALSIDVDAIDLSTLNVNTDSLSLGSTVHIIAEHLGINQQAIIQEVEIPLAEPGLKIHIGSETTSFLRDTIQRQKALADEVITIQSSNAKLNEAVTEVRTVADGAAATASTAQSTASGAATAAAGAQSTANAANTAAGNARTAADNAAATASAAQSTASAAATSAAAAQAAADKAWNVAQQNNLIRDGQFATTSATDHLTNSQYSTAADIGAATFLFKATGYVGLLPSPAVTYGKTVTTNAVLSRGVNGGADGIPCVPGRTYRLRISAAYTGGQPTAATVGFRHYLARRTSGTWTGGGSVGDTLIPVSVSTPDPSFRQLDFLWTAPANTDLFRPGFGRSATATPVAEWYVTNWSVTDVTEAVAAQAQADAAQVTAQTAESAAAAAQAQADAAQANAATAQSTADAASSAAAQAQSSADAAAQAAVDVGAEAAANLATTTLTLLSEIDQTAERVSAEISQIYTTKTSTTEQIDELRSYLELNAESLYLTFSQMQSIRADIDSDIDGVANTLSSLSTRFWWDTEGTHIGRSDDPVTMLLTHGELAFHMNGNKIAYFSGSAQRLFIGNAEITTTLIIGSEMFVPEPSGGMSIIPKGV